jgi:hypothetical protein
VMMSINPLDQMMRFAIWADSRLGDGGHFVSARLIEKLAAGALDVLAQLTFVLHPSDRPTVFLEWLVIAGTIASWKHLSRKAVAQIFMLLLAAFGMDTIGTLRSLQLPYFIYTDPLVIIAAAVLFTQSPALRKNRWAYAIGVTLLTAHIVAGSTQPIKNTLRTSKPMDFCEPRDHYTKRIEGFSYCF